MRHGRRVLENNEGALSGTDNYHDFIVPVGMVWYVENASAQCITTYDQFCWVIKIAPDSTYAYIHKSHVYTDNELMKPFIAFPGDTVRLRQKMTSGHTVSFNIEYWEAPYSEYREMVNAIIAPLEYTPKSQEKLDREYARRLTWQ